MRRRALLLTAPLGLASCASLLPAQKYIPRINWPLQPPPPAARLSATGAINPRGPILLVRAVNPAPGLEQRGLQSLDDNGSLSIDYYNLWAVPPAAALTQGLISWAQASGDFAAVITPGSRLTPDLIIEGTLSELLFDQASRQAQARMTFLVIKPATTITGFAQPLVQASLSASAPDQGEGPAGQVQAQTTAVAGLLSQAMAVLERYAA